MRWVPWAFLILLGATAARSQDGKPPPPPTRRDDVADVLHGVRIPDPYRWLEDQQSPETRAWINTQNHYTNYLLDSWPGRAALKQRLTELMMVDTIGVPYERGGRYFFLKRLAAQQQGSLYVREGPDGKDKVLVDPRRGADTMDLAQRYFGVSSNCFSLLSALALMPLRRRSSCVGSVGSSSSALLALCRANSR